MYRERNIFIGLVFWAVIAAVTSAVAAESKDEIFLRKSVALDAGPIRLADVALVKSQEQQKARLDNLIVGRFTVNDKDILVGNFEICRALAQAQINPATVDIFGASYCRVMVKNAQQVKKVEVDPENEVAQSAVNRKTEQQQTLADELTRTVAQLTGFDMARLKIDWRCNQKGFLQRPTEKNRFKIVPRTVITLGNICFDVVDNQQKGSRLDTKKSSPVEGGSAAVAVYGYVQLLCESVTTIRRLQMGEVITAADVKFMPRRISNYRDLGITNMDAVIGQEAARAIPPRTVVFPNMIRKLQLVKRDQDIKVHSKAGQVQVTLRGKALAGGGFGDEIMVRCGKNKVMVRGVVTGLGEVTIGGASNIPSQAIGTTSNKY
ncbi:MAG: hypothetical protein AMJ79_02540 [Phycisphaerae bacterium SM23_30]|nr:MAG: hypothetical protein AMJ79_02540 [Phycisphaerae bacterium SM23_30]